MEYAPEEYTRHYIVQALFRLMDEYAYEKISVTDIARKAGVGRATFYRYFKSKEEVIAYYLEHTKRAYIFSQHYFPRCKEDYRDVIIGVLELFRENERPIRMLQRARLEYLYLDFLNKEFVSTFERDHPGSSRVFLQMDGKLYRSQFDVNITEGLLFELRNMFGDKSVLVRPRKK